ncbi:putative cyclic nucleotide-gated ion channel 15 [Prunus avium]|uniref:Cyclic nucleotide-gated ion channel 15 n=1 Tax=Prunus avium TaxID=42229 RepID=A0A6P5RKJ6_PRUAV|nr:putative cyclic nucleotide-gated ion channel 15 [Prunus avium]
MGYEIYLSYIGPIICEIPDITKRLRLRLSFMRLRLAFRRLNGEEVDNCYAWKVETFEIVKILTIAFWRRLSIPMAILAALPVPQIAILVFFPKLRASRALNRMRIMNSLILLQYVPRIYLIYRDCINLNKKKLDNYISDIKRKAWVPWLLNFILYILASHVSFYLMSI